MLAQAIQAATSIETMQRAYEKNRQTVALGFLQFAATAQAKSFKNRLSSDDFDTLCKHMQQNAKASFLTHALLACC